MRDLAREELIAELLALRPAFEKEGVTRMALFGSRSRGDNRPDSDVDLLVQVEPGRKFSMLNLVGIGHIVQDHLGLEGNVIVGRNLDQRFESEIASDLVPIFG